MSPRTTTVIDVMHRGTAVGGVGVQQGGVPADEPNSLHNVTDRHDCSAWGTGWCGIRLDNDSRVERHRWIDLAFVYNYKQLAGFSMRGDALVRL